MATTTKKKVDPIEIAKWGAVVVGGILVYRIMRATGLLKSWSEMQQSNLVAQNELNVVNADLQDWTKPTFWKNPPTGYRMHRVEEQPARDWVKKMYDTHGFFNDDEEAMKGLIYKINGKAVYSCLADLFQETYGEDLTAWLKNYYSVSELSAPFTYLASLPTWEKIQS